MCATFGRSWNADLVPPEWHWPTSGPVSQFDPDASGTRTDSLARGWRPPLTRTCKHWSRERQPSSTFTRESSRGLARRRLCQAQDAGAYEATGTPEVEFSTVDQSPRRPVEAAQATT